MLGFIKTNGTSCRFVSMVTETVLDLPKSNPFHGIIKTSKRKALINKNYCAAVERNIAAKFGLQANEVGYIPKPTWYMHLETIEGKPLPVVVNKKTPDSGEYYLQFFPMSKAESTFHMPDGTQVAEETVYATMAKREQNEYKPIVNVVKLSNIKELRASGVIMQADDYADAEAALNDVSIDIGTGKVNELIPLPSNW
jgi:hypothetical protein